MPIIRPELLDRRWVTWAELIEAGWLQAYRRDKIAVKELRAFIEVLRDEFEVPYPLAHKRPLVSGRSLVLCAQEAVDSRIGNGPPVHPWPHSCSRRLAAS